MGEVYLLNLYPSTLTFKVVDPTTGNTYTYTLAPNQYVDISSDISPQSTDVEIVIPSFNMTIGLGLLQSSVQTLYFSQSGLNVQPTTPQQILQGGSTPSSSTPPPSSTSSQSSSPSSSSSTSTQTSTPSSSTSPSSTGEIYLLNLYPSTLVFKVVDLTTGNSQTYTLAPNQYVNISSVISSLSDEVEIVIPAFNMNIAQVLLQSSVQTLYFNEAGLGDQPITPQQILQGISSSTSSQSSSPPSSSSSSPPSSSTTSTSSSPPFEIYLLNLSPNNVTITVVDLTTGNSQTYTLAPNQYVNISSVISSLSDNVEVEVSGVGSFNIGGLFQSSIQTIYFWENEVGDSPYSPQQVLQSVSSSSSSQNNSSPSNSTSSSTSTPQSSSPSSSQTSQSTGSQGSSSSSSTGSQSNSSSSTPSSSSQSSSPPSSSSSSSQSSSTPTSSQSSTPPSTPSSSTSSSSSGSQSSNSTPPSTTPTSSPSSTSTPQSNSQSNSSSSSSASSSSSQSSSTSNNTPSSPSSSQGSSSSTSTSSQSSSPSSSTSTSTSQGTSSQNNSSSSSSPSSTSSSSIPTPISTQTSVSPSSPTTSPASSSTASPTTSTPSTTTISQSQVLAQIRAGDLSSLQSEIPEMPPDMVPVVSAVNQLYEMYDIPSGTPLSTAVQRLLSDIRDAYYKISNHKQEGVNTQQLSQLLQIYNTLVSNGLAPQSQSASKLRKLVQTSGTIPALPAVLGQSYPGNVYNNSNGTYSNFV